MLITPGASRRSARTRCRRLRIPLSARLLRAPARHPKPVANGMNREQRLRTNLDAIAARGTLRFVDHRQAVLVHRYRAELAHARAIGKTEAPPCASLRAPGNQRRCPAGFQAFIPRAHPRHVRAAGARKPRHPFLFRTRVNPQVRGDCCDSIRTTDRAFRRAGLALDCRHGERAAPRAPARATICAGKHSLDLVDAGVFKHVERPVGEGQR